MRERTDLSWKMLINVPKDEAGDLLLPDPWVIEARAWGCWHRRGGACERGWGPMQSDFQNPLYLEELHLPLGTLVCAPFGLDS